MKSAIITVSTIMLAFATFQIKAKLAKGPYALGLSVGLIVLGLLGYAIAAMLPQPGTSRSSRRDESSGFGAGCALIALILVGGGTAFVVYSGGLRKAVHSVFIAISPGYAKAAKQVDTIANLVALSTAYMVYSEAHGGQAPRTWEQLEQVGLHTTVRGFLGSKGYVVVLGVRLTDATVGTHNFMIGYPANPADDPIPVAMMGGMAKMLPADEFKEHLQRQQACMATAIVFEPQVEAIAHSDAADASSRPPLPPSAPSPPEAASPQPPPAIAHSAAAPDFERAPKVAPGPPPPPPVEPPPALRDNGRASSQASERDPFAEALPATSRPAARDESLAASAASAPAKSYARLNPSPGQPTALIGGSGGFAFDDVGKNHQPAVGFRYRLGNWAGAPALAEFQPLFHRDEPAQGKGLVMARDGYVVGGAQVVAAELVTAVRVLFVRQRSDGVLDPDASYYSDWIGEPGNPGNQSPQQVGAGQARVIGVCGRRSGVINALGLVLDKPAGR